MPKLHGGRLPRTTPRCRVVPWPVVPRLVVVKGLLGSRDDDAGGAEGSSFGEPMEIQELMLKIKVKETDIANLMLEMAGVKHLLSGRKDANATAAIVDSASVYKGEKKPALRTTLGKLQDLLNNLQGEKTALLTLRSKVQVQGNVLVPPLNDRIFTAPPQRATLISTPFHRWSRDCQSQLIGDQPKRWCRRPTWASYA